MQEVNRLVTNETVKDADAVSWSAYHASLQPSNKSFEFCVTATSLLPLFHDQAQSVAMIRHSMDVVSKAVRSLNPGQVPIITADQPLYTIAKQIQWNWPGTHGEDKFVVMFWGTAH